MTPTSPDPAPICYVEIPAPDPEATAAFYQAVFSWTVEPSGLTEQGYWTFSAGEGALAGAFDARLTAAEGGVLLYLKVDDIPRALIAAREAGGEVLQERKPVGGDFGFLGLFRDPAGNRCGLWSSR